MVMMIPGLDNKIAIFSTLFTLVVKLIIGGLTFGLLLFHIYLKCKGITTFEFITKRKENTSKRAVFPQKKIMKNKIALTQEERINGMSL